MRNAFGLFWSLVQGVVITGRHFLVNMARHTVRFFGFRTKRPGAVTVQYPEERKPLASRYRSLHRLMARENGKPRCVACMLCATVCPSECISIEAAEDADPEIQKVPASFLIDLNRCCFCGFCVEACPEDAIRMDTGVLDIARGTHEDLIVRLSDLLKYGVPEPSGARPRGPAG
jgi:NADH-quinone oxidoreductase subunit I